MLATWQTEWPAMRYILAVAVAIVVAACTLGQSASERAFLNGGSRAAQARQDADAILQGMQRAQLSEERVARDSNGGPVTR
jgi:hypothetical protein